MLVRALVVSSLSLVPIVACGGGGGLAVDPGLDGGDGGSPEAGLLGKSVGEACDDGDRRCRPGLACVNGTCAPGRSSESGAPCTISAECKEGLYCGPERTCSPAGTGGTAASCASDADCKSGLRCNIVGFGAQCQPEGTTDIGGACKTSGDCFGGLACAGGTCTPLPPGAPIAIPTWKGVECTDDPPPVVAYFRVPRGSNDGDFFRLPFPNDVRRDGNGRPALFGFPTPGSEILGFDVVDRYVKDVEQNADGFSAYATITMRFSGEVDFDSLKTQGAVRLVDVTADGPLNDLGLSWIATTGRSAYVCNNSIGIRPRDGEPFLPGHTYAAILTNAAKTPGGGAIGRSADLSALLAASAPADAVLAPAYARYAPLRAWAATKSFDLGTVLNAAVFTVAHTTRPAEKLGETIAAAPAPTASAWVKCGSAPSPCPDVTGDRACGAADPAFDELHALVTLPIFQKGTAPYLNPSDGGDLAYDGAGKPVVQRTEQVCMALTVPKGAAMPASGWPLVVYAHGTGGSYRSHVTEGVAKSLAASGIAVLGIDQVAHGPRRNGSTQSPNDLFFNFGNPAAARGNPLQGAADQLSLVRFARASTEVPFDRIAFWGHSQGATEGAIAMPHAADVSGVVLSGVGASLIDALLTKTSPVNIKAAVPFVLVDPSGVNEAHPVLSLLQNAIDPADPLSHARALDRHVFVPFGLSDTYTPSAVQATYVLAAGLGLAAPPASVVQPEAIGGLQPASVPVSGNLASGARTGVAREYAPAGYDGHFVVFRDPDGKKDAATFLADALAGVVPHVGP